VQGRTAGRRRQRDRAPGRKHRGGHRPPGRGLAGEPVHRARHRASGQHCRYRRAGGSAQRGHGGDQRRPLRIQAHRLPGPLQK